VLDAGSEKYEERNSRKQPLNDDEARQLVESVERVLVARGRKIEEYAPGSVDVDQFKGRTGNFRAPIVRVGETLLVGFHAETLGQLVD
jgi:hypothetical protein